MVELVDEVADVDGLAVDEHVEIILLSGRAKQDVDHGLHNVDVLMGPPGQHGDVGQGVAIDGGVKRAGNLALAVLADHLRQLQAQLAQVLFGGPLPAGALLVGVHVHGEPDHAGGGQLAHKLRGQGLSVGIDDGLPALGRDVAHQRHDVGIDERLAAGDGNAVGAAQLLDRLQFADDVRKRSVAVGVVFAVAPLAIQIAFRGRLKPRNGIVGQVPGQAVIRLRGKRSFSHGAPVHLAGISAAMAAAWRCALPQMPGSGNRQPGRRVKSPGRAPRPRPRARRRPCAA